MAKVDIEVVQRVLKENGVDVRLTAEILKQIRDAAAEDAVEREKPVKKQHLVLVSEPEEGLPKDLVGWVVQIPENASPHSTTDRIFKGAYDVNASKRGRMLPVKSVGEALESAGAKYFKDSELWVKTKLPVAVVKTDNVLPKDEFKVEKVDRRRRDEDDED